MVHRSTELANKNKLYMSVTLTKIKEADITALPSDLTESDKTNQLPNYNIAQLVKLVNPKDGDFLKYIPDALLNEEQIASKKVALNKQEKKLQTLREGSRQYALSDDTDIAPVTPNQTYGKDIELITPDKLE